MHHCTPAFMKTQKMLETLLFHVRQTAVEEFGEEQAVPKMKEYLREASLFQHGEPQEDEELMDAVENVFALAKESKNKHGVIYSIYTTLHPFLGGEE